MSANNVVHTEASRGVEGEVENTLRGEASLGGNGSGGPRITQPEGEHRREVSMTGAPNELVQLTPGLISQEIPV